MVRTTEVAAARSTTVVALLLTGLMVLGSLPVALPAPGPEPGLPPMDAGLAARLGLGDEVIEAIVQLEEPATKDDLLRARGLGLGVTPPLRSFPEIFAVRGPASGVHEFLLAGGVAWAEWNAPLDFHLDTARLASRAQSVPGNVPGMGGPLVIDGKVIDGTGVGVAVVDGGIDATHPDLPYGTKVKKNMNFACTTPGLVSTATQYCFGNWDLADGIPNQSGPGQPNICDPLWVDAPTSDPSSGHGTHVAGIVAGTGAASDGFFRGVAPGATLYGLGAGQGINILWSIESFDWILCNHNLVDPPIKVVNNSWGAAPSTTGCTPPAGYDNPEGGIRRLLVDTMVARGITVVFSSGNSGGTGSVACNSPTSRIPTPGVLGVASFNDEDRGTTDAPLSTFSSRGISSLARKDTWPDLSAPGDLISSTMSRTGHVANTPAFATPEVRDPNYIIISGTSMAAPHVAGVIALVKQANPALTPAQVEDLLEDTASKFNFAGGGAYASDTFNPGGDLSSFDKGHGLVNARAAVLQAAAMAGKAVSDTPAQPEDLAGKVFYLRTQPTGLGNVDLDYQNWELAAPSKAQPSMWSDAANMLQNSDAFAIPALYPQGGVSLVNTPVTVRFWASALGGVDLVNPLNPPSWTVRMQIGATNLLQRTGPEPLPLVGGPKMYEVTFPSVTASGTSMKVRWDSDSGLNTVTPQVSREANFANAIYYDSVWFPTSIAFGVASPDGQGLPGNAGQACVRERNLCFDTIQGAVDEAQAGEHVDVGPGTFPETVSVDKAVGVASLGGSPLTTIEGGVVLAAPGAGLSGFTVANAAPTCLVTMTAPGTSAENNVLLAGAGKGVCTVGAGGGLVRANTVGTPLSVEHAGAGATTVVDNAIGQAAGTGLLVQPGAGAPLVQGNDFRASTLHVRDLSGQLTGAALWGDNTFDRAVAVSQGGTLLRAVWGLVQPALDAAGAGDTVIVRSGTYPGAVTIPAGLAGLTLCSSGGPAACSDAAASTILDAGGPATALTVAAGGVTVRALTLRADPANGLAADPSGTDGFTLLRSVADAAVGVLACDATDLDVLQSAFPRGDAVVLCGAHTGNIEGNDFTDAAFGVALLPGTSGLAVDAERNCWASQTLSDVRAQVRDEGAANTVDVVPFLDAQCLAIVQGPTASFTLAPDPATRIAPVQFTDTSQAGAGRTLQSHAWDFGDGAGASASDPAHTFAALGTFTVTLTVTNDAELTSTATDTVTVVNIAPRAALGIPSGDANRVDPVAFEDLSTDPDGTVVAWAWDFGDGATSTARDPTHTYATLGTFTVSLSVTDQDGGTGSALGSVTVVNLAPSPAFVHDPEIPMILQLVEFTDASLDRDGSIASRLWEFDDGRTSTDPEVLHVFTTGGSHAVTLTVTDNDGATRTVTRQVFVCDPAVQTLGSVDVDHVHVEVEACIRINEATLGPVLSLLPL